MFRIMFIGKPLLLQEPDVWRPLMQSVGWLNKYAEHNYHYRKLNYKITCSGYLKKTNENIKTK
jgi:hypothetical protein